MKKYFANSEKAARNFLKSVGLYPKKSQANCACGESLAFEGIDGEGKIIITVIICETCYKEVNLTDKI